MDIRTTLGIAMVGIVGAIVFSVPVVLGAGEDGGPARGNAQATATARNIILLIADGMGPGHRTAARYVWYGPSGDLAMDGMPVAGSARTYSADNLVTDSAASATAMASGVALSLGVPEAIVSPGPTRPWVGGTNTTRPHMIPKGFSTQDAG